MGSGPASTPAARHAQMRRGGGGLATRSAPRGPAAAFTLVELLVVIAIIGILIAMLLPAVQSARGVDAEWMRTGIIQFRHHSVPQGT